MNTKDLSRLPPPPLQFKLLPGHAEERWGLSGLDCWRDPVLGVWVLLPDAPRRVFDGNLKMWVEVT